MTSFNSFGLSSAMTDSLARMEITVPTPIQAQAIPKGLEGHDILGSAQTGTGKTMAYLIPLISNLMKDERSTALIMAPTRELAAQIQEAARKLYGKKLITVLLIGGDSMFKQLVALKKHPRLIIGTPGRIHDHLTRGTLRLNEARFLVLDEVDRMLDMGFSEALKKIAEFLPETRQTFMFSATMPPSIKKLSMTYLKNPQLISIGSTTQPTAKIKQEILHTPSSDKYSCLVKELNEREGSVIVFVKTKHGADRLAEKLSKQNHPATAIHGDLRQRKREEAIKDFRNLVKRIMVATDVAARGLDISHIKHVINYDLPQCPEDYIHRIGRTGRAGMEGHALSFVSPEDMQKWKRIHHLMETGKDDSSLTAPAKSSRKRKARPQNSSGAPRKSEGFKSEKSKFQKPSGSPQKTGGFKSEKSKPDVKKTFSKQKFSKPGEGGHPSKKGKGSPFSKQSEGRHNSKPASFKRGAPKRGGGKRSSSFSGSWAA
jgi:superfamily II DNA/RNA helicase